MSSWRFGYSLVFLGLHLFSNSTTAGELVLVAETKINAIPGLPRENGVQDHKYEASGVAVRDGTWYVVLDNSLKILRVTPVEANGKWSWNQGSLSDLAGSDAKSEYEAITYGVLGDAARWYVMKEANKDDVGQVQEYDLSLMPTPIDEPTNVRFPVSNKGFEGAAWLWRCREGDPVGTSYILGLCEGNDCTDATAGTGMIKVLTRIPGDPDQWQLSTDPDSSPPGGTLRLPARFRDYSDMALYPPYPQSCDCDGVCDGSGEYTIAVVSQKDSQLWLGTLNTTTWTLTAGKTYSFPRTGAKKYCNVEGVAILSVSKQNGEITAARFAIASDAYNDSGNDDPCRETDQSLHIFKLPSR